MTDPGGSGGRVIAARYRLISELGRGGMGSVWRAEHLALRAPVAIKLLDPAIGNNPEMVERFMREAQSAAALRSMHVVQIFDYGMDGGVPYIAMELLNGESLRERLERTGRLAPKELSRIFGHVARAVAKAHEAGIVHRDLKPDNIFLVREDEEIAKVLDFGIAKVAQSAISDSGNVATRTGAMLGTPYYMSPEQARGNKTIDHRTDLWALAVIAFECLTGHRPFDSDALGDLILKICTTDAPVPSTIAPVPPAFDAWFRRGVRLEPEQRFQSAREMAEALAFAMGDSAAGREAISVDVPPANPDLVSTSAAAVAAVTVSRRSPSILGLGAVGLLLVVAMVIGFLFRGGAAKETAPTEPSAASAAPRPPVTEPMPPPASPPAPPPEPVEVAPAPAPPPKETEPEPSKAAAKVSPGEPRASRTPAKPATKAAEKKVVAAPSAPPPTKASVPADGRDLFNDRR